MISVSETIPVAELPTEITELAAKVFETTDKPDRSITCIYYMVNVQHPVIAMLKHRFCQKYGIDPHHPMSDIQRTAFELMLFRGDVLKMIEDDFKQRSESDAP
nr:MAG TPA: hypothetical protein [Caudoviricetes sp.]